MKILDLPQAIIDLLVLSEAGAAWPDPEPVGHELPPVGKLTLQMLPNSLRPALQDIAHRMQCPLEYVAAPLICAIGVVIGTAIGVRPKQRDNWTVTPNLWGAVVGPPGRMKSPAINAALRPLYRLDELNQRDYDTAASAYEVQQLQYKVQEDALKDELKSFSKGAKSNAASAAGGRTQQDVMNDLLQLRLAPPKEPIRKRCYTNDATLEALGMILDKNPRGLLVFQDELMGLLAGFEKPGREGERQGYLTGWNGDSPVHVDRVSRDHLYINPFCISVFGGIQPDRMAHYMSETIGALGNDGLLQRFQVLVYPDDPPTAPIVDQAPNQMALDDLNKLFIKIANQAERLGAEEDPDNGKLYFRFDDAAQQRVYSWLEDLDELTRTQEPPILAEHLGKYRKLVPSLALIFHVVEIASGNIQTGSKIPLATFQLALDWANLLEEHARRIYAISTNQQLQAAAALAKKLRQGRLQDKFSQRDILRRGWASLKDLDSIRPACDELEAAHWIRRIVSDGPAKQGRPASPNYEINPAVLSGKIP